MEVTETSDSIKIQSLNSVYNREYFLLLGIKIVESDEEKKVGGLYQFYKEKSKKKKEIDPLESVVSVANEHFKDSTEKMTESDLDNFFSSGLNKKELVIKKDKKYTLKTVDKEIQEVYNRSKTIFNFDSGFTYSEYSKIIKDLYIQLAYLAFLNFEIETIDFKQVFKINGRYVLLEKNIKNVEGREETINFKELKIKMVELTGKKYEKGQFERDLSMIEGTEIYKYKDLYFEKA
jgi:hypothetical protein